MALGRGCSRGGAPCPFSTVGEEGEEASVERPANQGYSLTVSFQTSGSVTWCTMVHTPSVIKYANTRANVGVNHTDNSGRLTYQRDSPRETEQDFP